VPHALSVSADTKSAPNRRARPRSLIPIAFLSALDTRQSNALQRDHGGSDIALLRQAGRARCAAPSGAEKLEGVPQRESNRAGSRLIDPLTHPNALDVTLVFGDGGDAGVNPRRGAVAVRGPPAESRQLNSSGNEFALRAPRGEKERAQCGCA
jgi:hypothetical protein